MIDLKNPGLTVDVIIPTCRPDGRYEELLKRLKRQTYPIRRIIVINTEKDWYPASLPEQPDQLEVHHIRKREFDHGGTRDLAARMSDSDIILFLTQDALPADRFLVERLIGCFSDEAVGAAYARQLPARDCSVIERYTRKFNYPETSRVKSRADLPELGIKTYFCSNVCAAYRRELYEKLGGFPRKTIFNEDMIFTAGLINAGWSVAYAAEARVIHSHNYSGLQQFKRNFDLAVSQKQFGEIFDGVSSESEGLRLVRNTAGYLVRTGRAALLPLLIYSSVCKFAGYRLGKQYDRLPMWLVKKCTMNASFWEK